MTRDKKLRKLIEDFIKEQDKNSPDTSTVDKVYERKGFNIVEIDNDNGMCQYDYQYNF